jgi:hypothetical protein
MLTTVHQFYAMGSDCAVHLCVETAADFEQIAGAAEAEIRRIECRYSRYRNDSELARINRVAANGGSIEIDAETAGLIVYATVRASALMSAFGVSGPCKRSIVRLDCQFQPRRSLCPRIIVACEIIAAIKKRDHIFLVERFTAGVAKVGWNARKVEVNSVALGDGIDAVEISDPLILDKRGDGTLRNRQDILVDGLPFGIDFSISDNEQSRLRCGSSRFLIVGNKRKYRRSDKDLSGDASIYM